MKTTEGREWEGTGGEKGKGGKRSVVESKKFLKIDPGVPECQKIKNDGRDYGSEHFEV